MAFVLAPLAPSLALALVLTFTRAVIGGPFQMVMDVLERTAVFSLYIAYPLTLMLGLPAFLILRGHVRPSALRCTLAGTAMALGPLALLYAMGLDLPGWMIGDRELVGTTAALGALGGITFWALAAAVLTRGSSKAA